MNLYVRLALPRSSAGSRRACPWLRGYARSRPLKTIPPGAGLKVAQARPRVVPRVTVSLRKLSSGYRLAVA